MEKTDLRPFSRRVHVTEINTTSANRDGEHQGAVYVFCANLSQLLGR